jgi:hypothetical protein
VAYTATVTYTNGSQVVLRVKGRTEIEGRQAALEQVDASLELERILLRPVPASLGTEWARWQRHEKEHQAKLAQDAAEVARQRAKSERRRTAARKTKRKPPDYVGKGWLLDPEGEDTCHYDLDGLAEAITEPDQAWITPERRVRHWLETTIPDIAQ